MTSFSWWNKLTTFVTVNMLWQKSRKPRVSANISEESTRIFEIPQYPHNKVMARCSSVCQKLAFY